MIRGGRGGPRDRHRGPVRCGTIRPTVQPPCPEETPACRASRRPSSSSTRASSRAGRTCSTCSARCSSRPSAYRYLRGREVVAHGTGWVERIVVDADDISTYFTPLAITLNIDSFEHLEFETRPDQLLVYTLVQGDERVDRRVRADRPGRRGPLAVRPAPARVRHRRLRPDGAARARSPRGRVADREAGAAMDRRRAAATVDGRSPRELVARSEPAQGFGVQRRGQGGNGPGDVERSRPAPGRGGGDRCLLQVRRTRHRPRHGGRAGLTTFMVMAYIIFVNPSILSQRLGHRSGRRPASPPPQRSSPAS